MSQKYWVIRKNRREGPFTVAEMREAGNVYRDTQIMPPGLAGFFAGPKPIQAYVEIDETFPVRPTTNADGEQSQVTGKSQESPSAAEASFETSTRLHTAQPANLIIEALQAQFTNAAGGVKRTEDDSLVVSVIDPTFGSINRSDTTYVQLRPIDGGFLVVASTHYVPSAAFWVLLLVLIFTALGWLIPIAFYLTQKQTVQTRIERVFARIKDEFHDAAPAAVAKPPAPAPAPPSQDGNDMAALEMLEKLGELRDKGVLTQEEFDAKKKQILGV